MATNPSALDVVLRDVVATYPIPVFVEPEIFDDHTGIVMITTDHRSKAGILVDTALPPSERIAATAERVADWLVESLPGAGLAAVWPECPLHPGTHPLEARPAPSEAVWTCPKTGDPIAAVGTLGSPAREPRSERSPDTA